MKEAVLYRKLAGKAVICELCGHRCTLKEGQTGICSVRKNEGGRLITLVYGRAISQHVDPIEKKPLYHFYPGSRAYSIATAGCNFRCQWCQNWQIAQMPREQGLIQGESILPESIVARAKRSGSRSIAYTYTEPTIFFEYTFEIAKIARRENIANVYVTNGYMTPEMLKFCHPNLDAANVDLKAFNDKTYRRYTGGNLQPVLDSLILMKQLGIWVEVTTLVIPGLNDSEAELGAMAEFIAHELGCDTPWHLSRFFPHYKLNQVAPTPLATLRRAQEIGVQNGLQFVYLGNTGEPAQTRCPNCKTILIERQGYSPPQIWLKEGHCPQCDTPIAGVW